MRPPPYIIIIAYSVALVTIIMHALAAIALTTWTDLCVISFK